jgi:hypothetical protein
MKAWRLVHLFTSRGLDRDHLLGTEHPLATNIMAMLSGDELERSPKD